MEGIATGAGALRIGIVDGEALLLDGVDEIDGRTTQVRGAQPVNHQVDAVVCPTDCMNAEYQQKRSPENLWKP